MKTLCFWLSLGLAGIALSGSDAAAATRGYSGTQIFSTSGGDKDPGEPNHCGEPGGASSWFFYKAPSTGVLIVDTKGSSFDTVLAVYIGPGTDYATLTNVTCNNDAIPGETWSKVVLSVTAATMYYIAVDGVGGASGTVNLNYQLGEPLTITNQPQAQIQMVGSSATFTVGAKGMNPLAFQWFFGQTQIEGATQASMTLPAIDFSFEGPYQVRVSDAGSSIFSAPAMLTICGPMPGTNSVWISPMVLDGTSALRVVGRAATGTVLEASENLLNWVPLTTNHSSGDLFNIDQPMDRPQRYFRLRIAP